MADLVVTITESVTLNGAARGSSNALTISGVDDDITITPSVATDMTVEYQVFS